MPVVEKGLRERREKAREMKLSPKLLFVLALASSVSARPHSQEMAGGEYQADITSHSPPSTSLFVVSEPSASEAHPTVTHYATEFEGDHSLQEATVVEQAFSRYALYTVHLQFASGVEQSLELTAPPGGLQPEMRDMSGDSVPNDLVLTSKLLGLPVVVLLNEGHDHLSVAVSPGAFTSGENRASRPQQTLAAAALVSSRFRSGGLTSCGDSKNPHLEEKYLSPRASQSTRDAEHRSALGRSPPALVTPL